MGQEISLDLLNSWRDRLRKPRDHRDRSEEAASPGAVFEVEEG